MEYFAHPREKLIDHLIMVNELASKYGEEINSSKVTGMLGLMHDVGKHTKAFQDVLEGKRTKIDHAIVASEALYKLMCNREFICDSEMISSMMLHILSGHHSDFYGGYNEEKQYIDLDDMYDTPADYSFAPTRNNNKNNALSSEDEFNEVIDYIKRNRLYQNIDKSDHLNIDKMNEAARMLYARMLFSCLVDADYTATNYACNHIEYDSSGMKSIIDELLKEHELDTVYCLEKLDQYHDDLVGKKSFSPINGLRNKVYSDAEKTGKTLPCGLYKMTAPTGLGKTISLMKFALEQAKKNGQKRVIVVLPFLSIIEQNAKEYRKIFGNDMVIESDSMAELTDEQRELSYRWDAPIIVTTSVTFFQTMFSAKAPMLRKLHQIANSVVVFDESQSLGFKYTSVTIRSLEALAHHFNTTVLLSTATQPAYDMRKDLDVDIQEVISDVNGLYRDYGKIKNTVVEFDTSLEGYSYNDLAEKFKNDKEVLYVVNTTTKAKELYDAVKPYHKEYVFLLSSRLCAEHKKDVIEMVKNCLKENKPCHLISTQCIEAGVDLDFPKGYREYAPLTSVIQTMGRINRNGKAEGYALVSNLKDDSCPDDYYKNEKRLTYSIVEKNKGNIDLNAELIDQYYKKLYSGIEGCDDGYNGGKRDKEGSISLAEYEEDIYAMYKAYHLIEDAEQYNIIVPYEHDIQKFEEYANRYQNNGYIMKKQDMKFCHDICVGIIGNGKAAAFIENHCHRLNIRTRDAIISTNWFIADKDSIYDIKTGLVTRNSDSMALFL
ncbi:CRISPR-associated helicase/endonuclease Cas3 [Butyrivibrio fibrisolvens]|uniref:CRISPR-associated helicase/endonuclease Cas3 n=1 Tax=Butyrivibrio fibrisolvens TaxID=831 RepID=UPI0004097E5B|nr:CRISPR-associated helicase/endonuclease Cas3 [Butyrivibrio fibrisolvens]